MAAAPGVVLVAGGGSGMGREIAVELARSGWHVGVCDVDEAAMGDAVREAAGVGTCQAWTADITVAADVERFVSEAEESLGPVTALVNNALHAVEGFVLDLDEAAWRRTIEV